MKDLKAFDKKHAGERGFVIGGGSSITRLQKNGFDFSRLWNEVSIGANKAYKLFEPTYLVWGDSNFFDRFKDDLFQLHCIMFYGRMFSSPRYESPPQDNKRFYAVKRVIEGKERYMLPLSFNDPISFWQNSGVVALRIAYLLGCNPIYLIGIDLGSYEKVWFHDGYGKSKGPGKRWYELSKEIFIQTIEQLENEGVYVYSCSPVSPLNAVIPYVDIKNLDWNM